MPAPVPPSSSFYKRSLPASCIPFDSPDGKKFFANALAEGTMESYFPLAQQFLTQNEPAYCGIGTLCMILNALNVDPGRQWKGPWRWYEQEMLDCCRPLVDIKESGITLAEFACLAKCNSLHERTHYATSTSLEQFRRDIELASTTPSVHMAISYSRKALLQTGTGHFSPIGGYSRKDDMVLVLDVARFKYPCYWVSVGLLWKALAEVDPVSGVSRGYSILSPHSLKEASSGALVTLNFNKSTWSRFVRHMPRNLDVQELLNYVKSSGVMPVSERAVQQGQDAIAYAEEWRQLRTVCKKSPAYETIQLSGDDQSTALMTLFIRALQRYRGEPAFIKEKGMESVVGFLVSQMKNLEKCCKDEEAEGGCECIITGSQKCH
ncbi:hypothetical protein YB2330_002608 [Saitoella coloradoensis]